MTADKLFLLCIDGSENSFRAATFIGELISEMDAKITLLYVLHEEEAVRMPTPPDDNTYLSSSNIAPAVKILEELKVDYAVSVQIGNPKEIIIEMSPKYDAIVMGYKGMTGRSITEVLFGGVAEYVLHHSTRPVIMVP
ncbi:MAG: hypothetical protein PWQ62_818 [Candidatus Methanomethylophilaceae archaeon]|nr:hypothetical protein [Candidatus Methanomethylophilaceae archaeon]